ncbi:MAG: hypothetical protein ACK52R_03825 [Betaproteobacteria bacterium]|jgi:hypothetical protein|nr:hypothetical protein [Rubrivivax sp.]
MLCFNVDQIEFLREQREERLRHDLFDKARGPFAERCRQLNDVQLRDAIDKTIDKALAAGVGSNIGIAVFFKVALCWGLSFQENESIPWVYPIDRWVGEDSENWILRVHDIALATARKERRWAWIKTTTT